MIGRARIFLTATKHSSRKACHFATCVLFSTTALLHWPALIADDQMFLLNCPSDVLPVMRERTAFTGYYGKR